MKKSFLSSAILFGAFALSFGQETKPTVQEAKPVDNPNAPEITFETDVHDFGTLPKGAPCVYEFGFKNTGKEPLIISDAQKSCGCTVPSFPKEPIAPGASGVIKVQYDSNRSGVFTKSVTIVSNAKNSPKVITIKGKIDTPPAEDVFPGNGSATNSGTPFEKKN